MMKSIKGLTVYFLLVLISSLGCGFDGCSDDDLETIDTVKKPTFSTTLGTSYEVSISTPTEGASIKYTIDLSDPKTSDTAVEGNLVTVNLLTTVRAYAYKEDMKDSDVSQYNVPRFNKAKFIEYNADGEENGFGTVKYYYTYEYDCNGNKVIEIWYDPADSAKKCSQENNIDYYILFEYDSNGRLTKETKYNANGTDGKWFTDDDAVDTYSTFTYTDDNLTEKRQYDANDNVLYFTSYEYNANNMVKAIYYNSPGGDGGTWQFDGSDIVDYYISYTYIENNIDTEIKYTAPGGAEDTWLLDENDIIGYFITYSYTDNNLSQKIKYNAPGGAEETWLLNGSDIVEFHIIYTYIDNKLQREVKYISPGGALDTWLLDENDIIGSYLTYTYDNVDYYYTYDYPSGKLTRMNKYMEYSTDTLDHYFTYLYDGDNLSTESKFNGETDQVEYHFAYQYEDGKLIRKEKYKGNGTENPDYHYAYSYDADDKLIKKEKFNVSNVTAESYYSYEYNTDSSLKYEIMFKNPGSDTKVITWNIDITAGVDSGGYYTINGINYDTDGTQIGDAIPEDDNDSEFLNEILNKLSSIIEGVSYSRTELNIPGLEGGECLITISSDISQSTGTITVVFNFTDFDNGEDIIINGVITKTLEGSINTNGELSGSLNGTFTGSLSITFTDPAWSDSDFIRDSYISYEYNTEGLLEKETRYKDPGTDGVWLTGDDDTIDYYITYTYNTNNNIEKETLYKDFGVDEIWLNDDDTIDHYFTYQYDGEDNLERKIKYKEYGTFIIEFNSAGIDEVWFNDNDVVNYSTFEFECEK
ncbi:MAG: chitobiase/beta-hexosaminidase C-terminal domain-containing protein [Spirochaetota bacterium]|nr:chitobiase/beta-hexosaminidase C-terminal domain-containing protein [Spirochaetota bacterium]